MNSRPVGLPIALAIAAMASLQYGASTAKQLFPALGPGGVTFYRLAFAAFLLGAARRPWRTRLTREQWRAILEYGVVLAAMNLVFYCAIERLPLGVAVAIEFLGPLAVAIFSSRRRLDFLWVAFAVTGIALLLPIAPSGSALDPLGIVFAFGAAIGWGGYIVMSQRAGDRVPVGTATAYGVLIATVVLIPFGVFGAGERLLSSAILPQAISVGLFASAIPYTLEMLALQQLPKQTFSILMSLEPAIAALAGRIFLHEHLTGGQSFAIACVLVASVGCSITAGRRRA